MLLTWGDQNLLSTAGIKQHTLADGLSAFLWAKGYFFDSIGKMYSNSEIVGWLTEQLPGRSLKYLLADMNGCFTILAAYPELHTVELGVDRIASVPVYLSVSHSQLAISDDFWELARLQEKAAYDPIGLAGMLLLGHTNGPHTMLKDIEIPLPGSFYSFKIGDTIQRSHLVYWTNAYCPRAVKDYKQLRLETAEMLERVFNRHAAAIQERGWTAEIALSGGLDSRLAAGLLHRAGVRIKALSYGPDGNRESETSEKIARALSIPHQNFIINDPGLFSPQVIEAQTKYVGAQSRFTTGIGAQMALSGYNPNRVFITGHPGNLPTGQVSGRGSTLLRSARQASQYLLNNVGIPILEETIRQILPSIWHPDLKHELYAGLPFQPGDPIGSFEGWLYYFHVSNLLLLEMRIYERYGNWLLPYLDYELVDFYNTIPLKYRYLRRLHIDAILNHLFVNDLEQLGKILLSGETPLKVPNIPFRDTILMKTPPSLIGDLYLMRHTRRVQRARRQGKFQSKKTPWGPDPLEYWWHEYPDYKKQVLAILENWDGLGGMVNTAGLIDALSRPAHPLFIRFVVATMLTLESFQRLIETGRPQDIQKELNHA